ncbi:MAG: 23S rRNA (guanosine(2251)-2'-O)-methyltransferase RlmB [Acidobacteriota bacterium]
MRPVDHVYGVQPVRALLRRGGVERLYVAPGRRGKAVREIIDLAREQRLPVRTTGKKALDQMAGGGSHQGVVAITLIRSYGSREEVLALCAAGEPAFLVLLDGVQDPRNLGALLRTAAATGVHGVFLPRRRAAGLTGTVIKAAAGMVGQVPVVREASLVNLLEFLQKQGIWTVSVQAGGSPPWSGFDFTLPVALVLGGEGRGARPLLRRRCEASVGLPLAGGVESLNVSVAFGAIAYEIVRQREGKRRGAGVRGPGMES